MCVRACVCVQVISTEQRQFDSWVLTGEGEEVVEKGSLEARVYMAVDAEAGTLQAQIMVYTYMYMQ